MPDKVRPLKMESVITGGGQEDGGYPTETNPTQDYLSAKGIAFEGSDSRLVDLTSSGSIQFTDVQETVPVTVRLLRTAANNIFDNSTNGFVSTNVQAAIEEAKDVPVIEVFSGTNATGSTALTVLSGMTQSKPAGVYLVFFNASFFIVSNAASVTFGLYVGGSLIPGTQMVIQGTGSNAKQTGTIIKQITLTSTQTVDIRWQTSAGTPNCTARAMNIMQIG